MKKICYVATIPAVVHAFLRGHIQAAAEKYEVTVVCNSTDADLLAGLNARLVFLRIERKPSPLQDFRILLQLFKLFRDERFDIVHSIMPKTGMLAMLAARLAGVPIRIHTFTGQVWVTQRGLRRMVLQWFDRLTGSFANTVLADSPSQRDFLVNAGVLPANKAQLIGAGSICGVDAQRFSPNAQTRVAVRSELDIGAGQTMILYVGRLNRDKGLLDLAAAFAVLAQHHADLFLLLVGEEEDVTYSYIQQLCNGQHAQLRRVRFTPDPERYMAAADIYCLPSYREGFGLTIIEAAACGIPAVASRIYGITDAVEDGKTGLLFPAGNVAMLTQQLQTLVENPALRRQMGEAARLRALELFPSQKITVALLALYDQLLVQHE